MTVPQIQREVFVGGDPNGYNIMRIDLIQGYGCLVEDGCGLDFHPFSKGTKRRKVTNDSHGVDIVLEDGSTHCLTHCFVRGCPHDMQRNMEGGKFSMHQFQSAQKKFSMSLRHGHVLECRRHIVVIALCIVCRWRWWW